MAEDKDAKTEQPTSKRMGKAWSEGNIPVSNEVKSVAMLIGALVVVGILAPWVAKELAHYLRAFIERPQTMALDIETFQTFVISVVLKVAILLAFPVFVLVIAAFVGTTGQIGLVYTPKKMSFNLSNLSPISGFKRLFSLMSLVE